MFASTFCGGRATVMRSSMSKKCMKKYMHVSLAGIQRSVDIPLFPPCGGSLNPQDKHLGFHANQRFLHRMSYVYPATKCVLKYTGPMTQLCKEAAHKRYLACRRHHVCTNYQLRLHHMRTLACLHGVRIYV